MSDKLKVLLLFSLLILITHKSYAAGEFELFPEPAPLPLEKIINESGDSETLETLKGKFLVLNFWATWCGPCIVELPSLDKLAKELGSEQIKIVTISIDEGGIVQAKNFLKERKVTNLLIFADPQKRLHSALGVRGMPTSFIVNDNLEVVARYEGTTDWMKPEIKNQLLQLVK